jgi:RNA polymerase sigma factor (sigma-70 family)
MALPQLGAALRHLRRLAAPSDDEACTDRHLLHAFVRRRDEAAFAMLVRRHGPLVLRVCRQVLHQAQDAEDAFQATFLVLARQAAFIRQSGSLAGWLHKVAFHVASKARRGSLRRRTHESRVPPMTPTGPTPEVSWHDVQTVLHEEIQRLPESWRAPFVLCVLEGKSRQDAARQLGCKEGTLDSRLARARERLRQRLTRRGVTLSAVLAALELSEDESLAALAPLLGSTVTAVFQVAAVSPRVGTLVEGVLRSMRATKLRTMTGLLLAVTLALAGLGVLTYFVQAGKSPEASAEVAQPPKEENPSPERTILAGVVVDEAGKAVAAAEVELKYARESLRTVSNKDGTFQVTAADPPRYDFRLLARSREGNRLGYLFLGKVEKKDRQSLRVVLKAPRRLDVAVADGKEQPLADARVGVLSEMLIVAQAVSDAKGRATLRVPADCSIHHVYAWQHGNGFDYRSFEKSRESSDRNAKAPAVPTTAIALKLAGARTLRVTVRDADGKPLAKMRMHPWYFKKPGETTDINVSGSIAEFGATTDEQGIATWDWLPNWESRPMTFWPQVEDHVNRRLSWDPKAGDKATLVLDRLEWLRGKATHVNGAPAAGITIRVGGDGYDFDGHFSAETKTGPYGRYAVRVPPNRIYLVVVANEKWAAEPQTGFAVWPKKATPEKDFVLRPATRVFGRATTGKDQKPLAGEFLVLTQKGADLLKRPDLELPNPRQSNKYVQASVGHTTTTDAEGRFSFHVGPGEYYLLGGVPAKPAEFTITNQAQVEVNLQVPLAETGVLKGLVVTGTPPAPVPDASVKGIYKGDYNRSFSVKTNAVGRFDSHRGKVRLVLHAKSADGKLAGVIELGPDEEIVTIPLAKVATAKGRLLDGETGEPIGHREIVYGAHVPVTEGPNPAFVTAFGGSVKTDRGGRFELTGLVAGQKYHVDVTLESKKGSRSVKTFVPSAGEAVDLGDVRLAPAYRPPTNAELRIAAFSEKGTPTARFDTVRKDVRLARQHGLVIFANPGDLLTQQLFALIRDRDAMRDTLENYRTLWIATDADRLTAAQPLAKLLRVDLRPEATPVLVVADERGEPVAVLEGATLLRDGRVHGPSVRDFLEARAPARLDAEKLLTDALALARKENKRVLVQETATWCGPCWRLSRFLDRHRDVWEKDYVWIKLDHRWTNAAELGKRLRKDAQGGIPWVAILDSDGKVLTTSNDKEGQNIGFPTDDPAVAHFAAMLRGTAQRLTEAEFTRLVDALQAARTP